MPDPVIRIFLVHGTYFVSFNNFRIEEDYTIKRLPWAVYERLLERDPNESLPKYDGKRVRYALIVANLVHRRPIEVVRDEYGYLEFDEEGRFKEPEHENEESSALDMLDFISIEQRDKRVIDARHKFARKRYFDKHRWEPTDQIVTAMAEAIFGKLI